jgi:serine/threonine protein phosphatase 1
MRTLVMGDVHGGYRALVQVLERAGFDPENDRLICLGDVCDGWSQTKECIDYFLGLKNLVYIWGNHDRWAYEWMIGLVHLSDFWLWYNQGGRATMASYGHEDTGWTPVQSLGKVPESHKEFFRNALPYFEENGRVFVHGGWNYLRQPHPSQTSLDDLTWNRSLWQHAVELHGDPIYWKDGVPPQITRFDEVYVGHTSTTPWGWKTPVQR